MKWFWIFRQRFVKRGTTNDVQSFSTSDDTSSDEKGYFSCSTNSSPAELKYFNSHVQRTGLGYEQNDDSLDDGSQLWRNKPVIAIPSFYPRKDSKSKDCSRSSSSSEKEESNYPPSPKKQSCFTCGKPGHVVWNCVHRPDKVNSFSKQIRVRTNYRGNSKPTGVQKNKVEKQQNHNLKPKCFATNCKQKFAGSVKKLKSSVRNKLKLVSKATHVWKQVQLNKSDASKCSKPPANAVSSTIPKVTKTWVPISK
jgi:hypothetical protein